MMLDLFRIANDHSSACVAAALAICLAAGWLLAELVARARQSRGRARRSWQVGAAIVAGLGVWTTHFMAMIGYRPDLPLSYNFPVTVLSALIGIAGVGLPLAIAATTRRPEMRMGLGAFAGVGIGAMHFTGMSALDGCVQVQSLQASILAYAFGAGFLALEGALPRRYASSAATCLLFTLAVTGAHFISIAGVSLSALEETGQKAGDQVTLSIFTAAGAAVLFLGAFMTILAAKRFEAQEKAHSAILSTALQNMSNGLVFIDDTGRLGLFNQRFIEMFGIAPGGLTIGMTGAECLASVSRACGWAEKKRDDVGESIARRMASPALETSEYAMSDGRVFEIETSPVAGGGCVLTFDDVTRDRQAQSQISHMAFHDPLTGLPNRRALHQRLEQGFSPKRRYKLLLIDLDRFKAVNDTFGHGVGDQLLIEVSRRLIAISGEEGFVARLGGDEMAVLVYGDLDSATRVAEAIVEAIARPYVFGQATASVGCSIGMCCTDDARTPEELMQFSDIALYEAKRAGRGRSTCYRPGMREEVAKRHRLEADMRTALAEGQFHLAYQPVLSLGDDTVVGYEALLRWDHPLLGAIPPASFVPLAEETGLIVPIGEWVIDEACRAAAAWSDGRYVAVNVSPVQLRSPLLLAHLTRALADSGLSPNRLEVELTETAIVEDGSQIAHMLTDLRALGIKVAMDDFGTGYSSLAHLRDFPLDRIKIDRSFVWSAESDRHSLAVIRAVLLMGRELGIATLAEGVETPSQLDLLRSLGCDAVQGYLVGRPRRLERAGAAVA